MQEPGMKWCFDRRNGDSAGHDDADAAAGLSLPTALLERHGARALNPEHAPAIQGQGTVRPTVYRARTLLVPGHLLADKFFVDSVNNALARAGMLLIPPRPAQDDDLRGVPRPVAEDLRQLPRVAVLTAVPPADDPTRPVVVDAWVALQTLRAAASASKQSAKRVRRRELLDESNVATISLEHLLVGSAITGSPAGGMGGGLAGNDTGVGGPTSTDSYLFNGGDTRTPVAVCLEAPRRLPLRECEKKYGRRPVVAVLDTGLREHWWLDVKAKAGGGYQIQPDGFVTTDDKIQQAIRREGEHAADRGDHPRQVIEDAWDTPVAANPLMGEIDTDTGHCTFISGIVRQVAPDARVLAIRIMHSDGIVNEGDLLCGLRHLARRIAKAEAGRMGEMVDVVSLSLGYFNESGDAALTSGLRKVLEVLLGLGVTVVTAAGNYTTSRKFYPAAFASQDKPGQVPLISVGALNPNLTQALFSDGGPWINAWACGALMVSTYPVDVQGSRRPEIEEHADPGPDVPGDGAPLPGKRESLDPDDYRSGFALWSGTSFSAPLVAADIVKALLQDKSEPGLWLSKTGCGAATDRALAALTSLGWKD
jgi:Subtilase family